MHARSPCVPHVHRFPAEEQRVGACSTAHLVRAVPVGDARSLSCAGCCTLNNRSHQAAREFLSIQLCHVQSRCWFGIFVWKQGAAVGLGEARGQDGQESRAPGLVAQALACGFSEAWAPPKPSAAGGGCTKASSWGRAVQSGRVSVRTLES